MTNIEKNEQQTEIKKKVNLKDAMMQKLASKKQNATAGQSNNGLIKKTQPLKSQQTKKTNNQRRRTGV
ncbi:hypothetical protein BGM26_15990 [Bacillus sp. FJAT-29790]|uniref:hypothetical protein n=1 Tax=Bacillus sp. FJAT-29790 TaxID=1895002 RepID=UPI001C2361ED|nr:hypothetical protein [Bacillus sp. FJAT-29790]MBU8880455.1 hypothetical protein [Bacillus sp. FJAT-29790]